MRSLAPHSTSRPRRRSGPVAGVVLAMGLAACGSSNSTATPDTPAASHDTNPAVTPGPTATATARPVVTPTPAPSFPALDLLWQQGGPAPSRPETWQPAIDPITGDIWVAASYDSIYWIFSPDGTYLESWGMPGSGNGQLDLATHEQNPSGFGSLAFLPDGSFFIADIGNDRVERFDSKRRFVTSWGGFGTGDGQFARPFMVRTDGTTVYVSDDDRLDIQAFDLSGKFLHSIHWEVGFFTLDQGGRIIATDGLNGNPKLTKDGGGISVLDPVTGDQLAHYPLTVPGFPVGLALDATGDIFVNIAPERAQTNPVALVELDPNGTTIRTWSTAGETIAFAPDSKAIYLGAYWTFIRKFAIPAE